MTRHEDTRRRLRRRAAIGRRQGSRHRRRRDAIASRNPGSPRTEPGDRGDAAGQLGKHDALTAPSRKMVDQMRAQVTAGTLTKTRATALEARLAQANAPLCRVGGDRGGPGHGQRGHGGGSCILRADCDYRHPIWGEVKKKRRLKPLGHRSAHAARSRQRRWPQSRRPTARTVEGAHGSADHHREDGSRRRSHGGQSSQTRRTRSRGWPCPPPGRGDKQAHTGASAGASGWALRRSTPDGTAAANWLNSLPVRPDDDFPSHRAPQATRPGLGEFGTSLRGIERECQAIETRWSAAAHSRPRLRGADSRSRRRCEGGRTAHLFGAV